MAVAARWRLATWQTCGRRCAGCPAVARPAICNAARRTGPGITMALAFGVAILRMAPHCTFRGPQRMLKGRRPQREFRRDLAPLTRAAGDLRGGSGGDPLVGAGLFLRFPKPRAIAGLPTGGGPGASIFPQPAMMRGTNSCRRLREQLERQPGPVSRDGWRASRL